MLDLQSELHQAGQPHQELYEAVAALKRRHDLHPCSVRAGDGLSLRNDHDRAEVQDLVARYRKLPEDTRQRLPALLNSLAQLEVVVGDIEASQADFEHVTALVEDPIAQAEAHHNVYRAALERQRYPEALAALRRAVECDPDTFEPFPLATYVPQRIVTAGAFGVRFVCEHEGRTVLVTALRADSLDRDLYTLFRELRTLQELDHGALVRLHAYGYGGPEPARPYVVTDYLEGYEPLDQFLHRHGPLSPEEALEVAWPLARALQAIHHRGVLHRCLRPSAVMIQRMNKRLKIKLLDTGLALKRPLIHAATSHPDAQLLTSLGRTVARLKGYLPPELTGRPKGNVWLGPHSDFYSFGRLCALMLTGKPDPDTADRMLLPENWAALLNQCTGWTIQRRPGHAGPILDGLTASPEAEEQAKQIDKEIHEQTMGEIQAQIDAAPDQISPLLARATVYARQGEFDLALADLSRALELAPDDVSLWCRRAAVHARTDDHAAAVADYSQVLQREARHLEALVGRGEAYARLREYTAAVADYTEAIRQSPRDESLYFGRGNAYFALGEYARAAADYAEVLRLDPSHIWALGNRARAYLFHDEPGRALTDFNRLLTLDSTNVRALIDRAATHLELNHPDRALADYSRAIEIEPSPGLYLDRGNTHARIGNLDEALADYNQAVEQAPEHLGIRLARVRLYNRLNRLDEALGDLNFAVEQSPDDAALRRQRGELYQRMGRTDEALADFHEGLRLDPNDPLLRFFRGNLLADRGQLDHAIADYNVAILQDEEASGAFTNRGNARARLGEYEEALADYARAIELDPEDALAYANRAGIYARLGRTADALADYTEVLRLSPEDARAHSNRGVLLAREGEYERALADLDRAVELQPDLARAWMHRGNLQAQIGKVEQAIADLTRAIETDPNMFIARYERALLLTDPEAARADYDAVLSLQPDHLGARINRAELLAAQGEIPAALADLDHALSLDAKLALGYFARAQLLQQTGDHAAALADLDTLLDLQPEDVEALLLRGQVRLAVGDLEGARADNERAAAFASDDPRIWNNLAWLGVLCAAEADLMLEWARRAVEAGETPARLDTLAAAQANAGQFAEAIATLERALALATVDAELQPRLQARLEAYRAGRPWRWDDEQSLG